MASFLVGKTGERRLVKPDIPESSLFDGNDGSVLCKLKETVRVYVGKQGSSLLSTQILNRLNGCVAGI
jgi:hypothetical protein